MSVHKLKQGGKLLITNYFISKSQHFMSLLRKHVPVINCEQNISKKQNTQQLLSF